MAVDLVVAVASQSHKELSSEAGSTVWAAVERVATDASSVTFCWITEPLELLPLSRAWLACWFCCSAPSGGQSTRALLPANSVESCGTLVSILLSALLEVLR